MRLESLPDHAASVTRISWGWKALVLSLCCVGDLVALQVIWTRTDIAEGQFRRGYFEEIDGEAGLAIDTAVRPDTLPRYLLTEDGSLEIPSGMTAVISLEAGQRFEIESDSRRAPYVVIGMEAPVAPAASDLSIQPGEARLRDARTLALQDGRLAFVAWNATQPWRDDFARLDAVQQNCAPEGGPVAISITSGSLHVSVGRCSLIETVAPALLAVAAGPEWAMISRTPEWKSERTIQWPMFGLIALKEVAIWIGFGLVSAGAVATALAGAALWAPVEAALSWAAVLIIAVAATILRTMTFALWKLPRWARLPAVLTIAGSVAWLVAPGTKQFPQRILRTHQYNGQPDLCGVVGYSTVKGEGLRQERGSIRHLLDEKCPRCRGKTAALFASGETLSWVRNAYCLSDPSFGEGGQVTFLGEANDDFLSGLSSPRAALPMARAFVQPGITPWRDNHDSAASASLGRIDDQVSAIEDLIGCVHFRGAQFLFLHDFMASDMQVDRQPNRAAMLARRRAAVESTGGTFIDLREEFGGEAGISWFNDAVHLSSIGHRRVAELACEKRL